MRRSSRSFTLIELVVVIAVLAILAGGIIAKLDVFQLRSNKAVAASDMAGISRLMQVYVISNNRYPNGFDSLLDRTANDLWGITGTLALTDPSLDPQLIARSPGSTHQKLGTYVLTAGDINSLGRMGINTVYDLDATTNLPSNRFTVSHTLAVGDRVAIVNATTNGAAGNDGDAVAIMEQLYPRSTPTAGTPPSGTHVVALGLGRLCTMVGPSGPLQEAPMYANSANREQYYARDIVLFQVDSGGGRARYLGAYGSDGDRLDEELTEFYELANQE